MTDVRREQWTLAAATALLVAIVALVAFDLAADRVRGVGTFHLVVEGLVILIAGGGAVMLLLRLRQVVRESRLLRRELAASRLEAERWREEAQELLEGLGAAIGRQFERWELTPAEREVGVLLLRGLAHKEIARERGASERTVRQQAHSLYRKAGLGGRADLAGFFLDSLGLPEEEERG